jgi:nanoRNase/pAp phosphatase (c-di-AMP/oligoRNAs hydrolase)
MTLSAKERWRRFMGLFTGDDRVLIPINADPDAMASAMAIKRLLWRKVAAVTISNVNEIQRPDNLTMIRLIGLSLIPWEQIDPSAFNKVVMVDSQPDHHERFTGLSPTAIIDHHPVVHMAAAPFVDIRPKYGATASMMVEYLRAARISPSAKLATALYYAIKTDTSNFERQTLMEDLHAFQFVFKHSNIAMARCIESAEIRLDSLKYFERALDIMRIRKGRAFAHLGTVRHPDICVQIADFLMRIDTVNWSIVSGVHERKLVIIFRNDGIRKDAGRLASRLFGGLGSAGGHQSAARAEIVLDALDPSCSADPSKLAHWVIWQVEHYRRRRLRDNGGKS